jgi:hypothetical protein
LYSSARSAAFSSVMLLRLMSPPVKMLRSVCVSMRGLSERDSYFMQYRHYAFFALKQLLSKDLARLL